MWDSNSIFTASGASKALELAATLPKPKQLEFLEACRVARTNWESLISAPDVQYLYDTIA